MFLGHFAVAFAAKKTAPKVSLATLFAACQLLDLLWPFFLLLGLEHARIDPGNTAFTPLDFYDYPISHGLVGALCWSVCFALIYFGLKKNARASIIVGLVVFSHWVLDWITHRPDLPLMGNSSTKVGLGLWNYVPATMVVELGMFATGVLIYTRVTAAKSKTGSYALATLVAFFLIIYVMNLLGPPPPSVQAIALVGNISWLFVLWAWWIDRNRVSVVPVS